MKIIQTKKGERIVLNKAEREAFNKAHDIVVERFAKEGQLYNHKVREAVSWCFYGALRLGGIPEMMRYAAETPIEKKKEAKA